MTQKQFEEIINAILDYDKEVDRWCDFGINLYEAHNYKTGVGIAEYVGIIQTKFFNALFNETGVDWINWWLYEKCGREDMKAFNEDGSEIPTQTIEDLWNIVKDELA